MKKNNNTSNTAQAFWIGLGSLFSFMFSIVSAAILSRFLTKADYGTYKQVMYVYSTLLSVFTLGLPLAYSYFLPRVGLSEGKALVSKLNICFIIQGIVFSSVLFLGAGVIANILKNPDLESVLKVFSPAPIFILPTMGLQGILATYQKTIWNAAYTILSSTFMLLCVAIPVSFLRAEVDVAIWGFIVASFISCGVAMIIMNIPFRGVIREQTRVSYKDIFSYSIPLMIAGLLGVSISAADQFYVSRFFGQEVFADFANGSLELPFVGMVLSAGSAVLLPVFSRMIANHENEDSIIELWKRTAVKAAYILYPLVSFCIFFATEIMTFLYGQNYAASGLYFRIMLMVNFFTVIQFYPIILALGKTKQYAFNHIIIFFLVWGLEYGAVMIFNTAYAVTIVSVCCKIFKIFLMMNLVAHTIHVKFITLFPFKQLLSVFACCVFSGAVSYFVVICMGVSNLLIVLIIGFLLFAIFCYLLGRIMKIDYLEVIRPLTSKLIKR